MVPRMRTSSVTSHAWQLLEIVQPDVESSLSKADDLPLQLFFFRGHEPEDKTALWFVGGFEGASKADSHILGLLQKAVSKGTFVAQPDLFLTPVVKAMSLGNNGSKTSCEGFPTAQNSEASNHNLQVSTLMRWAQKTQAKALVSFSVGTPMIRYYNAPTDVIGRLSEIAERPAFLFGTEPEEKNEDGSIIPRAAFDKSLGLWCTEQEMVWIDFSVNGSLKTFDEVAQNEWRTCVGPALKWLTEGLRFNPPKEENLLPKLQVIPAIELPAEFANL